MKRDARNHIEGLDGLRGYAALAVCLYHASEIFGNPRLAPFAYIAVDLFFVLSGFVLLIRYESKLTNQNIGINTFFEFVSLRISRLYPLFLVASLLGFILNAYIFSQKGVTEILLPSAVSSLVRNIFVVPDFSISPSNPTGLLFPFAYQAWSVFWELMLSICFYFTVRFGKFLEAFIAIVSVSGLVYFTQNHLSLDLGWGINGSEIGFLRAFAGFYLGVLTARAYQFFETSKFQIDKTFFSFVAIGALAIVFYYFHFTYQSIYSLEIFFATIGFPVLVFSTAIGSFSILRLKPFVFLGRISYSVYLLHGPVAILSIFFMKENSTFAPSLYLGLIWSILMLGIAGLSFYLIERPCQNLLRRHLIKEPAL